MNDFASPSLSNGLGTSEAVSRLNMDDATWWKKQNSSPNCQPLNSPLSPLSFAFLNPDQRNAFNFSTPTSIESSNNKEKAEKTKLPKKSRSEIYSPTSSCSSSSSVAKKTLKVKDLFIVDDDDPLSSTKDGYEPKAHLGWASFGESIQPPAKNVTAPEPPQGKRKVYVMRQQKQERTRPYQINNPIVSRNLKAPKNANKFPISKPKSQLKPKPRKESSGSDNEDEIVDVVGIDEDEEAVKRQESGNPPDLPPQRPLGSRFEMQRQRKGSPIQYNNDFPRTSSFPSSRPSVRPLEKLETPLSKPSRSGSPPPHLEPQLNKSSSRSDSASSNEKDEGPEELIPEDDVDQRISGFLAHDPSQILKTKVSSSAFPVFPLSKSIMERQKAAIEMTKNAVIKRVPAPKSNAKNLTVAPKNVQVPAYAENTSITLYSNLNKPVIYPRDGCRTCVRCRERTVVDMSNFKFLEDSNVVAVRAHLCDQTRVMIARTALFNREYGRRLGDRAHGTIWQKPDEVTAQMTGFCSATVRRCIDIANLSIVPKCADRIGVSKNELSSLKTAFGEEKFCGQTMRTPHVLSHYYSVKAQNQAAAAAEAAQAALEAKQPSIPKVKTPEDLKREEEERKHHPLSYNITSSLNKVTVAPAPVATVPPVLPPALKKTVLRWSSIQAPRILRGPGKPTSYRVATVIPILKAEKEPETVSLHRRARGRPKKDRTEDDEKIKTVRMSRRLKSKKNVEIENVVRQTVDFLVATVSKRT